MWLRKSWGYFPPEANQVGGPGCLLQWAKLKDPSQEPPKTQSASFPGPSLPTNTHFPAVKIANAAATCFFLTTWTPTEPKPPPRCDPTSGFKTSKKPGGQMDFCPNPLFISRVMRSPSFPDDLCPLCTPHTLIIVMDPGQTSTERIFHLLYRQCINAMAHSYLSNMHAFQVGLFSHTFPSKSSNAIGFQSPAQKPQLLGWGIKV